MKGNKIYVAALALMAVLLMSAPAGAVINLTAHQLATGGRSDCSVCHLAHGGQGARLWPVAPVTATNFVGVVSTLCATCHWSTGTMAGIGNGQAPSDNYVYNTNSHGVQMTIAQIPAGSSLTLSGLPYSGDTAQTLPQGGVMECSSCHDVHNDQTNRPFLRRSVQTLCSNCHNGRNFQSGTDISGSTATFGVWGTNIRATNPGSHPVGTDITGDVTVAGNSPISFPNESAVQINAGTGLWSIGGHLALTGDTGGVACVTCHSVHGVRVDPSATETNPPTAAGPSSNMLILAQRSTGDEGDGSGRAVANGNGGFNRPCEACHAGPTPTGYTGGFRPNPGGTNDTHPVDDMAAQYDAGVTSFFGNTASVPAGGANDGGPTAGTNVTPIPICESCHTPHGAANDAARASITATGRAFALRDGAGTICNQCHTGTITGHHPVAISVATALSGAASYLVGTTGISTTTLECGTCHNGNGAHNWANASGIGLNPNWRPVNNARDNVAANERFVGTGTAPNYYPGTTCVDCHLANTGTVNPSNGVITGESEFQNLGTGTHYIGSFASTFFGTRTLRGVTGTPTVAVGAASGYTWPAGGWSRFGGTSAAPVMVCESCHELEPDKNGTAAATPHLLLARYVEGEAANQDYADFCEGCHGVPAGTHPMTSDTVGRTNTLLSTTTTNRLWISGSAPTNTPGGVGAAAGTSTWAANNMSCDSCHQPHSANTGGGSLILDAGVGTLVAGNVTGGTPVAVSLTGANVSPVGNRFNVALTIGTMPNYSRFCDQCHTYLQ